MKLVKKKITCFRVIFAPFIRRRNRQFETAQNTLCIAKTKNGIHHWTARTFIAKRNTLENNPRRRQLRRLSKVESYIMRCEIWRGRVCLLPREDTSSRFRIHGGADSYHFRRNSCIYMNAAQWLVKI